MLRSLLTDSTTASTTASSSLPFSLMPVATFTSKLASYIFGFRLLGVPPGGECLHVAISAPAPPPRCKWEKIIKD